MLTVAASGILFAQVSHAEDLFKKTETGYTQSIQVINLLENSELENPGMTPTPIVVQYFNGSDKPCWVSKLNYQEDVVTHAGPNLGCKEKISRISIEPSLVADKLNTYGAPISVEIDTTKFATQVIVLQAQAPVFNAKNGLVDQAGTIQTKTQTQLNK